MANNHWQDQPRDPETGRWWRRAADWALRDHEIKLRCTAAEYKMIEGAAKNAGLSKTAWVMRAIQLHAPLDGSGVTTVTKHQRQAVERMRRRRGY